MQFIMTGHKGLIGNSILRKLIENGNNPLYLIDLRDNLQKIRDIRNINNLRLNQKADTLIHLAAFCKINQSITNPDLPYQHNVLGTYKILEFCRKNDIPKIIFTSSSRVLSAEKNPYTASKIYGEELVKSYNESYGIDYVIIRPSTVYGPFNDLTKRLVDIFMLNILQGKELEIYGDRNKTLDFTYIDDFAQGFLLAMDQKNKEFNIASGTETKIEDVAKILINLHRSGNFKFLPAEIAQPQNVKIDTSKIKSLGFKPKFDINGGLEICYKWYKENFNDILASRKNDLNPNL
ncbi:MAG: NAD-dependent epimerase/dehydratase family protein [Nanoarchaeota archaeon]